MSNILRVGWIRSRVSQIGILRVGGSVSEEVIMRRSSVKRTSFVAPPVSKKTCQQMTSLVMREIRLHGQVPCVGLIPPFGGSKDVKKTQPLAVKIASSGTSYSLLIFHFSEQENISDISRSGAENRAGLCPLAIMENSSGNGYIFFHQGN